MWKPIELLQNIKEMEACLAVGKEVDKVSSKFTSLNKTIGKTIDEQIQLIGKKVEEYLTYKNQTNSCLFRFSILFFFLRSDPPI